MAGSVVRRPWRPGSVCYHRSPRRAWLGHGAEFPGRPSSQSPDPSENAASFVKRSLVIEKEEAISLEGRVTEVLGNSNFRVQVTEDHSVLAKVAGKMRRHRIRVLPGDRVTVEVSPYDLQRGRIVYRFRN